MSDKKDISIAVNKVSKYFIIPNTYSLLPVLEDISFTVEKGHFISIIGESGCGKTTLLRMLAGLDFPVSGEIYLYGEKIKAPNAKCGIMFQQDTLFPFLNVYENVAFGPRLLKKYNKHQIDNLLRMVRVEEFAKTYPNHLSGGLKQRVSLARSLANEPDILLLDEPLGALDAFTRVKLQDELINIWQKRKNTMVMITHDIDEAVYLSDTVIVLTPRPACIKTTISVDLSYPRDRANAQFILLRNTILNALYFDRNTK
jgi:ABC-type nitrate/sulfonate/bicarbonate transport system ATPase subunit